MVEDFCLYVGGLLVPLGVLPKVFGGFESSSAWDGEASLFLTAVDTFLSLNPSGTTSDVIALAMATTVKLSAWFQCFVEVRPCLGKPLGYYCYVTDCVERDAVTNWTICRVATLEDSRENGSLARLDVCKVCIVSNYFYFVRV